MKIKLWEKAETQKEFDVEFPIYRLHDVGGDIDDTVIFSCIRPVGNRFEETSITITHHYAASESSARISVNSNYHFDRSDANYHLGRGRYACTPAQWEGAVLKAREMVSRIVGASLGGVA